MISTLCILVPVRTTQAEDLQTFSQRLSLAPSLIRTTFEIPGSDSVRIKRATCFPISLMLEGRKIRWFFLSNEHVSSYEDTTRGMKLAVDTATVARNARDTILARDTVLAMRVHLLRKTLRFDLALWEPVDKTPPHIAIQTTGIQVDLMKDGRDAVVAERVLYSGFPLLLGEDTAWGQNYPLVIDGFVSQVIDARPEFTIQAPIFSGASGSPVLSQRDGRFVGVVYATVPGQESLLYAVKASRVLDWVRTVIDEETPPTTPSEKK